MLQEHTIMSRRMPDYTVALTFDDGPGETQGEGPGPRSLELAEYLASEKAFSSFFLIGNRAHRYPNIVRKMHTLGHLIGTHTYDHRALDQMVAKNEDPVPQILTGDMAVREILNLKESDPVLFRAPYGNWNADVAKKVMHEPRLNHCIGPIGWDMPVRDGDWYFWGHAFPPQEAAESFLREIEFHGKGIIDLHDHSDDERLGSVNRTFEMMQLLVPMLKQRGYSFVRLDEIEAIKTLMNRFGS